MRVNRGDAAPALYGIAFEDLWQDCAYGYLIPLNLVVYQCVRLYRWLKYGFYKRDLATEVETLRRELQESREYAWSLHSENHSLRALLRLRSVRGARVTGEAG